MDRREFLKIGGAVVVGGVLPPLLWGGCSSEREELTFSKVYPVPFWRTSYFQVATLIGTIAAAGAVSYFTAGAGAPASATFVSSVASWIGGGGPGSYMIGLSRIGSLVGGNAMTGAAILNGISIGLIGGGAAGKASLTLAGKVAEVLDLAINGVISIGELKEDLKRTVYNFKIKLPEELGGDQVKKLAEKIGELEEEVAEATADKDSEKVKELNAQLFLQYQLGLEFLKVGLEKRILQLGDLVVLGIIAYRNGHRELFGEALKGAEEFAPLLSNRSFLDYLWGVYHLSHPGKRGEGLRYLYRSHQQEKYAIEPALGIVSVLGGEYRKKRREIGKVVEECGEEFDTDLYNGYTLFNLYLKVATIALKERVWEDAAKYFLLAKDELGLFSLGKGEEILKYIDLEIAISEKNLKRWAKAREFLKSAIDRAKNEQEQRELLKIFKES